MVLNEQRTQKHRTTAVFRTSFSLCGSYDVPKVLPALLSGRSLASLLSPVSFSTGFYVEALFV